MISFYLTSLAAFSIMAVTCQFICHAQYRKHQGAGTKAFVLA